MGFHDRDYLREEQPGHSLTAPQTAVGLLLLINSVLFILDQFLDGHPLTNRLALSTDVVEKPWNFYELLTYAFVHSPRAFAHILFNMLALWFFGVDVEGVYGKAETLRIYAVAAIFGGLMFLASRLLVLHEPGFVVGSSGALACLIMLFILKFPHRTLLFFGLFPMPAWLFGLMWLVLDIAGYQGVLQGSGASTAYEVHLAGVLLAFAYHRFSWNFGRLVPAWWGRPRMSRGVFGGRPKLKVHAPADEPPSLDAEVDRILAKISDSGSDSLSADERRTLERASARYQRRKN